MDNADNTPVKNYGSDISVAAVSGVSGGGTGAVLIYLVQNFLPDDSPYKNLLIMLAPSVSVAIAGFWVWVIAVFNKRWREEKAEKTLAAMLEHLHKKLTDPSVPTKQKKIYEKQLATLEEKSFERKLRRILEE